MRILQIHCSYRLPAGEDTVVQAEAAMLTHRGHHVLQFVVPNASSSPTAIVEVSLSVHNPMSIRRTVAAVADFRPDIVHVHNTWFALGSAILPAIAKTGVPIVMTLHNYRSSCISGDLYRDDGVCTRCVGSGHWSGVLHRCYRDSFHLSLIAAAESSYHRARGTLRRNVTTFVTPSAFMRDRVIESGFDAEQVVVKPHFVTDCGPRDANPSVSPRVLFVGRLAPGKGVSALLRAWERADVDNLTLTVVGDGPLASELREGAPRNVEFVGWRSRAEVVALMLESRALVFPSEWYEPFGMVLLEAMAAGLPIVANCVADAASIISAHRDLLAQPRDDARLATCLNRLTNGEFVDAEGARMRTRYETMYTPDANVALLETLYDRALQARTANS